MFQRRIDRAHLRVRFCRDKARETVAGAAADTFARLRVAFVEHDAKRRMKWAQAKTSEIIGKLLQPRLVADRRVRVAGARRRLGGVFAAVAVHMIEPLRLGVVGLHVVVVDRPGGRQTAMVLDLAKVFLPKTKQRGPEEFGIAADVVVGVRMELIAIFVVPFLRGLIFPFEIDCAWIPVVFFTRHIAAAFENQDLFSRRRKLVRKRAASGAAANDDNVIVICCHGSLREVRERDLATLKG